LGEESERNRQERCKPDGGITGEMNPCENLHEFWHKIQFKSRHETKK